MKFSAESMSHSWALGVIVTIQLSMSSIDDLFLIYVGDTFIAERSDQGNMNFLQ